MKENRNIYLGDKFVALQYLMDGKEYKMYASGILKSSKENENAVVQYRASGKIIVKNDPVGYVYFFEGHENYGHFFDTVYDLQMHLFRVADHLRKECGATNCEILPERTSACLNDTGTTVYVCKDIIIPKKPYKTAIAWFVIANYNRYEETAYILRELIYDFEKEILIQIFNCHKRFLLAVFDTEQEANDYVLEHKLNNTGKIEVDLPF